MLLDDVIPTYETASRHSIWVAAEPARVYEAARQADLGYPWVVRVLMGLRAAPAWVIGVFRGRRPMIEPAHRWPSVGAAAFTLIAEEPGKEFVLGLMGRFWTPTGGVVPSGADRFRYMPPAGLAQAVWNFRVEAASGGTQLSTETRVRCADAATRQQFMRYWRIIRLGSALIRIGMLRHIRSLAERGAD